MTAPQTYSVHLDELAREQLLALSDDAASYPETATADSVRYLAEFIRSLLRTTPGSSQNHNVQVPPTRL